MLSRKRRFWIAAAVVYPVAMAALVWGMFHTRTVVLRNFDSPESHSNWQEWRSDVEKQQQEPQTVARRVPKSEEPPTLVLMRDYFVTCLTGAIVFVSMFYWSVAGLTIGAIAGDLRVAANP